MRILECLVSILVSFIISAIFNGCALQRDRDETDRKIFRLERHVEERFERIRDRREDGGRDDRRPFRPGSPGPHGAGPIGAGAAGPAPEPAASSATGDVGSGSVTLKLESGL